MKKYILLSLLLLLLCRLLYPHSRFGYFDSFPETGRRLNVESATLAPGETLSVHLTGIYRIANYSSSNSRIADVNSFGTIEAKRPGTAIIFVEHNDDVYRCKIQVCTPTSD